MHRFQEIECAREIGLINEVVEPELLDAEIDVWIQRFLHAAPKAIAATKALINKVSPQIQVYFMGMTTKGVIGLIVVFAGLGLTFELLVDQFGAVLQTIRNWVTAAPRS